MQQCNFDRYTLIHLVLFVYLFIIKKHAKINDARRSAYKDNLNLCTPLSLQGNSKAIVGFNLKGQNDFKIKSDGDVERKTLFGEENV